MEINKLLGVIIVSGLLFGCAKESSRTIESPTVNSYYSNYNGVKTNIAVGKFENRSS